MTPDEITRHELYRVESRVTWLTEELRRQEGKRDMLLRELAPNEGVDDRRRLPVR